MTDQRRFPIEVNGVPVPLNDLGAPDVNTLAGLAAYLVADADKADADARGWQDARNATGSIHTSTSALRRLIDAAVQPDRATPGTTPDHWAIADLLATVHRNHAVVQGICGCGLDVRGLGWARRHAEHVGAEQAAALAAAPSTESPEAHPAPTQVRDPDVGAPPVHLEPGDRIRLVIEGDVEEMADGFLGPMPVIRTASGRRYEPNHPTLAAARIERYAAPPAPTDQTDQTDLQETP